MTNEEFIKSVSLDGEEWRDVVGYEGSYMVSSLGRICTLKETFFQNHPLQKKQIMNQTLCKSVGYLRVSLYDKNGKRKYVSVHRIVAISFIPNEQNKPYIDHINGNRTDNRVCNLRWCTPSENSNNPISLERQRAARSGKTNSRSKQVIAILDELPHKIYSSMIEANKEGFTDDGIIQSIKNKCKHKGFHWMYLSDYENLVNMSKNV